MTTKIRIRPNAPAMATGRVFPHERYRAEIMRGDGVAMIAFGETPAEAEKKARQLLKAHRIAGPVAVDDQMRAPAFAAWETDGA